VITDSLELRILTDLPFGSLPPSHRAQMTPLMKSDRAKAVAAELALRIEDHEMAAGRKTRRGHRMKQFEDTLGAMLGELLYATTIEGVDRKLSWPMDKNIYRDLPFSHTDVKTIVDVLTSIGLLGFVPGRPHFSANAFVPGGPIAKSKGFVSSLRLTDDGCDWLNQRGLSGTTYADDFYDIVNLQPVVLRNESRRIRNEKQKGETLPIPKTPKAKTIVEEVNRLNEFLLGFELRPVPFRGLYRLFNEADHPQFDFDRGGRLYGVGRSYQLLPKDERLQMTIDGEPTAEIDISASYLTIVYGLFGLSLDRSVDLYEVNGFERDLIKDWTKTTLTVGELKKWPVGMSKAYKARTGKKIPTVGHIQAAVEARHPVLKRWSENPENWATLMYRESEVVIDTIISLMSQGIPSYPIHDSIVVRERDTEYAADVLTNVFVRRLGVEPSMKITTASGSRRI
jgi:hypothetical protein